MFIYSEKTLRINSYIAEKIEIGKYLLKFESNVVSEAPSSSAVDTWKQQSSYSIRSSYSCLYLNFLENAEKN